MSDDRMVATVGLLSIDKWQAFYRAGVEFSVWLDGEDVTSRCASADDREGWALLYRLDDRGRKCQDPARPGRVAIELVLGGVRYARYSAADQSAFTIGRVAVGPDDVIVMKVDHQITRATAASIRRQVQESWPNNRVIVLDADLTLKIVTATAAAGALSLDEVCDA